jgi:hypothetical protein
MVGWLCENFYGKYVDESIKKEINNFDDVQSAIHLFFTHEQAPPELIKKHQNLYNCIIREKKFHLEHLDDKLYLTSEELIDEFKRLKIPIQSGLGDVNVREFMKEKKNHEVEIAAKIIGTLARAREKQHLIVDFGDGKGYLTTRLALDGLKTLGIDANHNNSLEAEIRNEKLFKVWKHLVKKNADRNNVDLPEIDETKLDASNFRTVSSFIYGDTDLNELIEKAYPENDVSKEDICVIGLHGCGNLSANTLKHFVSNDNIKLLMNASCCYNLLFEEFTIDIFNDKERVMDRDNDFGFPLSDYLREREYSLGRNARMLATQSMARMLSQNNRPDDSLFYRAIFEKILRERFRKDQAVHVFTLGKMRRVKNLEDYLRRACQRLEITYDLTNEELEELERKHRYDKELMTFHYFIRLLHARTIETIIHLDRYLYLLENDIKNVYLVKMFDSVTSPRNLAVVAIKD